MAKEKRKVVAVLSDLMFRVKIEEAAKRAGLETVFVASQQDALEQAKGNPVVIILDLNHSGGEPLDTISKLKAGEETSKVKLLCYVSHVQTELIKSAQERGCETVLARSAFSQNLATILGRYAE